MKQNNRAIHALFYAKKEIKASVNRIFSYKKISLAPSSSGQGYRPLEQPFSFSLKEKEKPWEKRKRTRGLFVKRAWDPGSNPGGATFFFFLEKAVPKAQKRKACLQKFTLKRKSKF